MSWKRYIIGIIRRLKFTIGSLLKGNMRIIGIVASITTIFSLVIKFDLLFIIVVGLLVAIELPMFVYYFRLSRQQIISPIFVNEMLDKETYIWRSCTSNGLKEACELTRECFGNDFIEFDKLESWRQKCPEGFVEVVTNKGVLCACFVILGLTESFFDQFINGRVIEQDLDADSVLSNNDMIAAQRLYICGIVVKDHGKHIGSKRAKVLVWVMLQYVTELLGIENGRRFFAVAATDESEHLMQNLGFILKHDASLRRDHHNLYEIIVDKDCWNRIAQRIGDLSPMCRRE